MPPQLHKAVTSPCFVHSQLDSGMLSSEYFRSKQQLLHDENDVGLANSLQDLNRRIMPNIDSQFDDDEDELGNRFTKCLAETAVAVRDMSKQLGTLLDLHCVEYLLKRSHRSCSHSVRYPERSHRHKSSR